MVKSESLLVSIAFLFFMIFVLVACEGNGGSASSGGTPNVRSVEISGRVTDQAGSPVAGAQVVLYDTRGPVPNSQARGTSRSDGSYAVHDNPSNNQGGLITGASVLATTADGRQGRSVTFDYRPGDRLIENISVR
jgi:hypothetical protein